MRNEQMAKMEPDDASQRKRNHDERDLIPNVGKQKKPQLQGLVGRGVQRLDLNYDRSGTMVLHVEQRPAHTMAELYG